MTENHENEGVCPIIEEHRRKETASVLFWPAVVELFPSFEERGGLFVALGDEIDSIPSDVIPYGTLSYRQLLFVYQSRWDTKASKYWVLSLHFTVVVPPSLLHELDLLGQSSTPSNIG